jgi:hypothetical protein
MGVGASLPGKTILDSRYGKRMRNRMNRVRKCMNIARQAVMPRLVKSHLPLL